MALRFSEIVPKVAGGQSKRGDRPPAVPVPPRAAAPGRSPAPPPLRPRAPVAPDAPADETDRLVDAFLAEAAAPTPVPVAPAPLPAKSARAPQAAPPAPEPPEPVAPPTAERDRIADALLATDAVPGPGRPTESIQLPAGAGGSAEEWGSSTQEIAEELLKAAGGTAAARAGGSAGSLARMLSAALADEPEAPEGGAPAPARARGPATGDLAALPPADRWKALAAGLIAELEASFRTRSRHGPEEDAA